MATTPTGPDDGTYLVTWNGHGDALVLAEINTDGTLTAANRFSYSTWGAPTLTTVNGYGDLGFRYRYVGRFDVQWDDVSGAGLLYMHARHYSPEFGRFLPPDPSGQDANAYSYGTGNPISTLDPSGLEAMTLTEFLFCLNPWHLGLCQQYVVISAIASRVAEAEYPRSRPNGKQDALRHCIWQACLTVAIGRSWAERFGDMHEDWRRNPPLERRMDQHNNHVGRRIGLIKGGPPRVARFVPACKRRVENGRLMRLAER